jgi:hypothetical protein
MIQKAFIEEMFTDTSFSNLQFLVKRDKVEIFGHEYKYYPNKNYTTSNGDDLNRHAIHLNGSTSVTWSNVPPEVKRQGDYGVLNSFLFHNFTRSNFTDCYNVASYYGFIEGLFLYYPARNVTYYYSNKTQSDPYICPDKTTSLYYYPFCRDWFYLQYKAKTCKILIF